MEAAGIDPDRTKADETRDVLLALNANPNATDKQLSEAVFVPISMVRAAKGIKLPSSVRLDNLPDISNHVELDRDAL